MTIGLSAMGLSILLGLFYVVWRLRIDNYDISGSDTDFMHRTNSMAHSPDLNVEALVGDLSRQYSPAPSRGKTKFEDLMSPSHDNAPRPPPRPSLYVILGELFSRPFVVVIWVYYFAHTLWGE